MLVFTTKKTIQKNIKAVNLHVQPSFAGSEVPSSYNWAIELYDTKPETINKMKATIETECKQIRIEIICQIWKFHLFLLL